jgi:hypothetical protein
MASLADLRSIEEACPWLEDEFQADLELLAGGTAAASRMHAADLRVIARLAARVPRCPFDETGATPWTSFRREVAVARKVSDRAAAQVIRCALRLTSVLPQAMELLESGVLTASRTIALGHRAGGRPGRARPADRRRAGPCAGVAAGVADRAGGPPARAAP